MHGRTSDEEARVAHEAEAYERAFHRRHPFVWWSTLIGPFAISAALLALLFALNGGAFVQRLLATAAAGFFLFGKFLILGGHDPAVAHYQEFFSPEALFLLVVYMDVATALLLVFHAGALFRIPWLGNHLAALVADGRFILKSRPWMRRATFLATVAFVMFPLAATGSVGGAIFSRLLGMSRVASLLAILTGSVLGCGAMYFGASVVNRYLDRNDPVVTIGGIACIAGILLFLNLRYRRAKRRWLDGGGDG